jgi:hypothetical protein
MTPAADAVAGFFVPAAIRDRSVDIGRRLGAMDPADEPVKAEGQGKPERLIARLQALFDADRAALELMALGQPAILPLRRFLFRREPSGLYQPRVQAVGALAALRAEDVLLDFLRGAPDVDIVDPVERTGEDAVINAAARALSHRRDDEAFAAFVGIAECRSLPGIVEALGEMRRKKAIPYLIEGLASDFCRPAAETALRNFGSAARPALISAALNAIPSVEFESVSSLRTRRSAVTVLRDIDVTLEQWSVLQPLMQSTDKWLSALACSLGLSPGQPTLDQEGAVRRLFHLLCSSDWLLTVEIESWLAENYEATNRVIAELFERGDPMIQDDKVRQSLLRVTARIAKAGLTVSFQYACPSERDACAERMGRQN